MVKVLFDPGHGGRDSGAISSELREKDVVLPLTFLVAGNLQWLAKGSVEVLFTRQRDEYLTLTERVEIEKEAHVDLFVSMHCNSYTSADPRGFEVHYYSSQSKGEDVAKGLVGAVTGSFPLHGNGLKVNPRLYVLRKTNAPAVLVESLYVSNPVDCKLLASVTSRNILAWLIARGLWDSYSTWSN